MVPLIENEIVTKRKWIAQEDFIDLLAISPVSYTHLDVYKRQLLIPVVTAVASS